MSAISAARRNTRPQREIILTAGMIVITLIATMFLAKDLVFTLLHAGEDGPEVARIGLFTTVVFILVYGNVVYLVTRVGYFTRRMRHKPPAFEDLVARQWKRVEPIAVLVPSYKEDARTIRQTLLSAALQHHPRKRVVLLLDDPPYPMDRESARLLAAARRVPVEIANLLQEPKDQVEGAYREFEARRGVGQVDAHAELRELLGVYDRLIAWMDRCVSEGDPSDHTDHHFLAITFGEHKALLCDSARRLVVDLAGRSTTVDDFAREYQRLRDLFDVEITSFERKRYRNVSQEANKAANLNTYIGLLGKRVRERWRADGLHLKVITGDGEAAGASTIPDAAFVLTLDADSMLRPDYALRLSSVFTEPGNDRIAVVQTPYTAIPDAPGVLERIAGATTDIQYIVHQGFTWCDATFWVGANALLRKRALDDIRTEEEEGGYRVSKFIQDRTVIEDTESTVDLAARGWRLHNYPERLAFSATPPDFGSLLIQRRRWANGGLLIIPKLIKHALSRPFRPTAIASFLVRLHYLSSIATGSIGMLTLLLLPVDAGLLSAWLPVLAAAYISMYWRDLLLNGYLPGDILRVSAFNIMLLPINLAGVLKSLHQAVTGTRTPFARTPKVEGRTPAPAWSVIALWLLLGWSLVAGVLHLSQERWMYAAFSLVIASSVGYASVVFVGPKASWEDAMHPIRMGIEGLWQRIEKSESFGENVRSR